MILTAIDGDSTFPIIIPAWGFSVSPIAAPEEVPLGSLPVLRPSQAPPPVSLRANELRIAGLSVALLAALGYLGYLNGFIPLIRRSNGPFARALRQLKKLSRRGAGQALQRQAFRCLHVAFDETAGREDDATTPTNPTARRPRPSCVSAGSSTPTTRILWSCSWKTSSPAAPG